MEVQSVNGYSVVLGQRGRMGRKIASHRPPSHPRSSPTGGWTKWTRWSTRRPTLPFPTPPVPPITQGLLERLDPIPPRPAPLCIQREGKRHYKRGQTESRAPLSGEQSCTCGVDCTEAVDWQGVRVWFPASPKPPHNPTTLLYPSSLKRLSGAPLCHPYTASSCGLRNKCSIKINSRGTSTKK